MPNKIRIGVIGLKGLPAYGGAATVGENCIRHLQEQYEFTVYSTSSHAPKNGKIERYTQFVVKKFPVKKVNILYYYIINSSC